MHPDPVPTAARIRKRIAQMVVDYQNKGRYMDLNGDWHTDATGVLNAWEELDGLGVPLCPGDTLTTAIDALRSRKV